MAKKEWFDYNTKPKQMKQVLDGVSIIWNMCLKYFLFGVFNDTLLIEMFAA